MVRRTCPPGNKKSEQKTSSLRRATTHESRTPQSLKEGADGRDLCHPQPGRLVVTVGISNVPVEAKVYYGFIGVENVIQSYKSASRWKRVRDWGR